MTYDDSEKARLRGSVGANLARPTVGRFECLLCGRPMRDAGKQWECGCGFFYKPSVPGSIPKKYGQQSVTIKKLCRVCGRREVRGRQVYCAKCGAERQRRAKRLCARV